ncbi:MAG: hypothetical protein JSR26_02570 [Proteobacteria bacterium]|nr:hypothetical protein [Pseudomonadota bacterium]
MNKILIPALFVLCVGSAFAQTGSVTVSVGKTAATVSAADQKEADAFCLRETGTHVRSVTPKPHNDRAVECAGSPGRTYTREDIDRTGAINTADALRRLDPSIH